MSNLEARLQAAIDAEDMAEIERLRDLLDAEDAQRPAPASLHASALWYAEQGIPVFPLQAGSKVPHRGTHGVLDATTDSGRINRWWKAHPDSNIGLATGHIFDAVDIDGPAGQKSRMEHWGDIFAKVDADNLGKVLTPRQGGMHIYVPATGEGNKAGLLPGIDYRGNGGYVVAPPSAISEGNGAPGKYQWLGTPKLNGHRS